MILKIFQVESVSVPNSNKALNKTKDIYMCVCVCAFTYILWECGLRTVLIGFGKMDQWVKYLLDK